MCRRADKRGLCVGGVIQTCRGDGEEEEEEKEGERGGAGSLPSTAGHGRARCSLPGCQRAGDTGGPARGGDRAWWDRSPQPIAAQPRAYCWAPPGHLLGTPWALQPGTAGGHSWLWLAPPCYWCPPVGWVTPAQGHHDPPELVLCHLGSLGEIPGILPPALPCLPAH